MIMSLLLTSISRTLVWKRRLASAATTKCARSWSVI
jgi:hypothetical protein